MASVASATTCDILMSVDRSLYPQPPWRECTTEEALSWSTIPLQYRKWQGGVIVEMSVPEKAAVDAAAEDAEIDEEQVRMNQKGTRAMNQEMLSYVNELRALQTPPLAEIPWEDFNSGWRARRDDMKGSPGGGRRNG